MSYLKTMNLPANYTTMSEEEMQYTEGGNAVQTVLGGVLAVGVSVALLYVGGVAVKGIFGMFNPETVSNAVNGVKNVYDDFVAAWN